MDHASVLSSRASRGDGGSGVVVASVLVLRERKRRTIQQGARDRWCGRSLDTYTRILDTLRIHYTTLH